MIFPSGILSTFSINILVLPDPSRQTDETHGYYQAREISQIISPQKTAPQYFAPKYDQKVISKERIWIWGGGA